MAAMANEPESEDVLAKYERLGRERARQFPRRGQVVATFGFVPLRPEPDPEAVRRSEARKTAESAGVLVR